MGALKEPAPPAHLAFVTGKLAAPALRELLAELAPAAGFRYEVITLNIAVAALMTTDWAAARLELPPDVERAILPGHCRGDVEVLARKTGVPVERGPEDLRDLPSYFGQPEERRRGYGAHAMEIIAEINHVPRLPPREVLAIAKRYRAAGADVIDLGCDPDGPFADIGELVRLLRDTGLRVSIDSLDPAEIRPAVEAGAELVLSVNRSNLERVADLDCELVVIPDEPSSLSGLERSAEELERRGRRYRLDPVIEPIGFGFARSLERYLEVRERFPEAEILMGVGNLTELTGVDSAGINVALAGFCAELGIGSVLTTEVAPWACSSVRELDLARRLVHHAVSGGHIPKHLEPDLHLLRDERLLRHGAAALEAIAEQIKDRNFRIFAEDGEIHVMNSSGHHRGTDPFELFDRLEVPDPGHAFYLGFEMAKALTALTLGKNYVQDNALHWGFLTAEESSHLERRRRGRNSSESYRDSDGGV